MPMCLNESFYIDKRISKLMNHSAAHTK